MGRLQAYAVSRLSVWPIDNGVSMTKYCMFGPIIQRNAGLTFSIVFQGGWSPGGERVGGGVAADVGAPGGETKLILKRRAPVWLVPPCLL